MVPFNLIAITPRLVEEKSYKEQRECLASDWGALFAKEPLLQPFLPLNLSYEIAFEKYMSCISGVILSGGNDLALYNDNALSHIRDNYERLIIEHCIQRQLPILGICRGAQMLGAYFHSSIVACVGHVGKHAIRSKEQCFVVNSYHNYAIKEVKKPLCPLAVADDLTIEAFMHEYLPIWGIMWHIERESGMCLLSTEIIQKFTQKCDDISQGL